MPRGATASAPLIDVQIVEHPVVLPQDRFGARMGAGGECVFLGRTRRDVHPEHGPLQRLRYQAYGPLARQTLLDLAGVACRRHGCSAVRIHHAVGEVPPGEASVLVQVLCSHRAEAFEACRFLIDSLKRSAPIWKQEHWEDGTTWSEGHPAEPA